MLLKPPRIRYQKRAAPWHAAAPRHRQDTNLDLLRATAVLMIVVFHVLLSLGMVSGRLGWLMGLGRWAVFDVLARAADGNGPGSVVWRAILTLGLEPPEAGTLKSAARPGSPI